jgi:hypothetical protein
MKGPNPVPEIANNAKIAIGSPRLGKSRAGFEAITRMMVCSSTHSRVDQISAIVPPTIVAVVDPQQPCRNRARITVWTFFALENDEKQN